VNDLSDNNSKKKCDIVKRMDKIDKQIAEAKTICCKAKWYRKSRANFRCEKCDKDVTLEIMFLYQALIE
jgi:hypothetical protein